jgi:branched-chain amino acid transport system substrate-binding protein
MKKIYTLLTLSMIAVLWLSACNSADVENAAATVEAVATSVDVDVEAAQATAQAAIDSVDLEAAQATAEALAEEAGVDLEAAQMTAEAMIADVDVDGMQATVEALAAEAGIDTDAAQATVEAMANDAMDAVDGEDEVMMGECNVDLTGETIYIHQHAGREGPLAAILGEGFAFATQDAVAEINDHDGICGATLEVVYRETMYDVEQEVAAYEEARAFDPKPAILLTYGSGATVALKDRVVEDQIVHLVAGLNAEAIYNPANGYTIGAAPIYSDQFAGFLQWAQDNWAEIKPESAGDDIVVGVIGWANSFGEGAITPETLAFADGLGITILPLEQQVPDPAGDPTGQIQNLALGGANII